MAQNQHNNDTIVETALLGFDGPPEAVRRTIRAMEGELAARNGSTTFDELREIANRHAKDNGVEITTDVRPWLLPNPWASYFRGRSSAYRAGRYGQRTVIGTSTWLLDCPAEVVEAALAAGFTPYHLDADALGTPKGPPIAIERPTAAPLTMVGESHYPRTLLEILIGRGATAGYVDGPRSPLLVPEVGVVMPVDLSRYLDDAAQRIAKRIAEAIPSAFLGDFADTLDGAANIATRGAASTDLAAPLRALQMIRRVYTTEVCGDPCGLPALCRAVAMSLRLRVTTAPVLH